MQSQILLGLWSLRLNHTVMFITSVYHHLCCGVKHEYDGIWKDNATRLKTCNPHSRHLVVDSDSPQEVETNKEIVFTYDVNFEESDIKWVSRWDNYLLMTDDQIHWFSIVNSDGHPLPVWDGRHDHAADAVPRRIQVQPAGDPGGRPGGNGVEARPWRRFQAPGPRRPAVRVCRYGRPVLRDAARHLALRHPWAPVSVEPGSAHHGHAAPLGLHGPPRRVLGAALQGIQGVGVEEGHRQDGDDVPRRRVRRLLRDERIHLGREVLWCRAVHHHVRAAPPLVRHLCAAGLRRELPLIQEAAHGGPGAHEQDTAADPGAAVVHAPSRVGADQRRAPIWCGVRRALLHSDVHLAAPVLLHLWLPVPGVRHPGRHLLRDPRRAVLLPALRRDPRRAVLLPALRRGLRMVVEVLPDGRLVSAVHLPVRHLLLLHQAGHQQALYIFLYATFYFFTKLDITKAVSGVLYFGYTLIASYAFFVLTGTIGFYARKID